MLSVSLVIVNSSFVKGDPLLPWSSVAVFAEPEAGKEQSFQERAMSGGAAPGRRGADPRWIPPQPWWSERPSLSGTIKDRKGAE